MPATLKWMNQQLTFPQDVVPRHLPKKAKGNSTVRAEGTEQKSTAAPRK
jgi:hypothetical protein